MRTNRINKQIQFWVEDSRAHLWVPALLCLALSFWIWDSYAIPKTLAITLQLEQPGTVQVFVDEGSGHTEARSMSQVITDTGKDRRLEFNLTDYPKIASIRIDPSDNDGIIQISGIEFKNNGRWFKESISGLEHGESHEIRFDRKAKQHRLFIYPDQGSVDPYFVISNHNFNSVEPGKLVWKRILFHLFALLIGVAIGAITAKIWITVLVQLVNAGRLVFVSLRWIVEQYVFWIDRFSMKWSLVNPTSCAAAGLIFAALATYLNLDTPLFKDRSLRRGSEVVFEVSRGETHSTHVFYRTEQGYATERSHFVHFEPEKLPYEVRIPIQEVRDDIIRLRVDPLEREGEVTIRNLRLVNYAGTEYPVDMDGWSPNKTAKIAASGKRFMTVTASGNDPYVVSPEMRIDMSAPFSIPIYAAFPFVIWFFTTLALLISNRIATEGLSFQKIRMLQRR